MFGIGMPELIIIFLIALIIIGPKKLPDLARALGKGMAEFRKATNEIKTSLDVEDKLKGMEEDLADSVSGLIETHDAEERIVGDDETGIEPDKRENNEDIAEKKEDDR
jgi:TatA/E family protein of Tat protein translocase